MLLTLWGKLNSDVPVSSYIVHGDSHLGDYSLKYLAPFPYLYEITFLDLGQML